MPAREVESKLDSVGDVSTWTRTEVNICSDARVGEV